MIGSSICRWILVSVIWLAACSPVAQTRPPDTTAAPTVTAEMVISDGPTASAIQMAPLEPAPTTATIRNRFLELAYDLPSESDAIYKRSVEAHGV